MSHDNRHIFTQPNGRLSIIECSCEDADPTVPSRVDKALFEAARFTLDNPALTGDDLEEWRKNVHFDQYDGPAVALTARECKIFDLPTDRYFRNAWEDTGVVVAVNLSEARAIHMGQIRRVRDQELKRVSGSEYRHAPELEALLTPERQAQLQTLRDIPETFDLNKHTTPEDLKAAWPPELPPREPNDR